MSTETTAPIVADDEFTPEETAALDAYRSGKPVEASEPAETQVAPDEAEPVEAAKAPVQGETDEEAVDGEITIDSNGTARDTRTGKFVPKSAMLRYKGEARQAKEAAETAQRQLIQTRERLAILTEATHPEPQSQQQDNTPPDPETDIFGYAKWAQQQITDLNKRIAQAETATTEKFNAYRAQDAFRHDVASFRSKNPNFDDAYKHLVENRGRELEALGVSDPAERQTMLDREAADIVRDAIAKGNSPAQLLYNLSLARGFSPKPANSNPSPNDDARAKAEADLERIQKGQQASQTLRGSGTGANIGEQLTLTRLANMSDDEYSSARSSYIAKHGKSAWVNLTGMP